MTPRHYLLAAALVLAAMLRLPGIAWGLPPVTEQVRQSDLRSSYAFDEDDILSGAAKASVSRLDFDPYEYHWGTLHGELTLIALDTAQALGGFQTPWRLAYYNLLGSDFTRVYIAGRLVAVAMALLTVFLLFLFESWRGAFAGFLIAVSPSHMLQSDQVRVDVTMTAMLTLMLLLATKSARWVFIGIAAGLSIAAKYSAISAVVAIALTALWRKGFTWQRVAQTIGGAALGFIAGSPYILVKAPAYYDEINRYLTANAHVPSNFLPSPVMLFLLHAANIARFSLGPIAFVLALIGLFWVLRRRYESDWLIVAAIAGYAVILLPLHWPLIRYDLPLTMMLGLCAGIALERLPERWRLPVAAAALVMPLLGCVAQIHYMRSPHPGNLMLQRILEVAPPGSPISRLFPEEPPLDRKVYPMGPDLFLGGVTRNPPPWILTSNLAEGQYSPAVLALIASSYDEVARVESRPFLAWATLGETRSPHDWKYTHCNLVLYRRRQ